MAKPKEHGALEPLEDSDDLYTKMVSPWAQAAARTGMSTKRFRELIKYLEIEASDGVVQVSLSRAYAGLKWKEEYIALAPTITAFVREQYAKGLSLEEMKSLAVEQGRDWKVRSIETIYAIHRKEMNQTPLTVSEIIRDSISKGLTKNQTIAELDKAELSYNRKSVGEIYSAIKSGRR